MMKNPKPVTLVLGEKQLVLLARGIVQAAFDAAVSGKPPAPISLGTPSQAQSPLPPIGTPLEDGIFAGLTIHDNVPVKLILLPGDEKMTWDEGMKWAEKQSGVLPSRFDQLVLFKNLKKEFKEDWYWSGEQFAPHPSCAWFQYFSNGYQYDYRKGDSLRVRAVRRSAIQ